MSTRTRIFKGIFISYQISPKQSVYPILLWHFCVLQSPLILFHHSHFQIHPSGKVQARCRWGLREFFSLLAKVTTEQADNVDRGTDSLETGSGWTFRVAIWKRKLAVCSSFCLLVHSWWKSACFVFRCLPSNGSASLVCNVLPYFFHGDFRLFLNTSCWQWGHKFSGTEEQGSWTQDV